MTIVRKHKRRTKKGKPTTVKRHKRKVRKKTPILFHGTHKPAAHFIEKEGLKTAKELNKEVPFSVERSQKTDPEQTYFFKDPEHAETWAKVVAFKMGLPPAVLEVDVPEEGLERDFNMPFGESYKRKGSIPKERIKILGD